MAYLAEENALEPRIMINQLSSTPPPLLPAALGYKHPARSTPVPSARPGRTVGPSTTTATPRERHRRSTAWMKAPGQEPAMWCGNSSRGPVPFKKLPPRHLPSPTTAFALLRRSFVPRFGLILRLDFLERRKRKPCEARARGWCRCTMVGL